MSSLLVIVAIIGLLASSTTSLLHISQKRVTSRALGLSVSHIDNLLEAGRRTQNWSPALSEVRAYFQVKSFRGMNPVILTKAIKLFSIAGLVDDAVGLLRNARAAGFEKVNRHHYNAAMMACRNHKRFSGGIELWEEMTVVHKIKPDKMSISLVISMLGSLGSWEKAISIYRDAVDRVGVYDEGILLELMNCLNRNQQNGQSYEVYKEARHRDPSYSPSPGIFTATIAALAGLEDRTAEMQDVYEESLVTVGEDKILRYNYERGLRRHNGEVEGSTPSSRDATNEGTSTNFKELLRMAASSGDYRYAVKEATKWVERGRFSDGGVTSALKLFGNANRADRVEKLLEALKAQHFVLNTFHLNACMAAFIRCKKPARALRIFREEITHPDSYSYGSALQALSKTGDVKGALQLFDSMEEKGSVHYNTIMSCLSKNGLWRRALDLFIDMSESGMTDDISHRIMLSALDESGQSALAKEIRKEIATSETLITRENVSQFLVEEEVAIKVLDNYEQLRPFSETGHLPELSKAGTLLAKLSERPEQSSALVHFLAVADRMQEVSKLISGMEQRMANGERNIRQHLGNTYNSAILACGVLGEAEDAMGFYQRMKDHNVPRNEATYRALLNIYRNWDDQAAEITQLAAEDGVYLA